MPENNHPSGTLVYAWSSYFALTISEKYLYSNEMCTVDLVPPAIYSLSFTESPDRLDLLRAYGNDGDGFSIVTTFSNSEQDETLSQNTLDVFEKHKNKNPTQRKIQTDTGNKIITSEPILFRICYDNESKLKTLNELNKPLNKILTALPKIDVNISKDVYYVLYATLLEIMYLYKDEQYSTEKEIRAIQAMPLTDVELDERDPGRLYCTTNPFLFLNSSSKIVIGPKIQNKQVALWNLRYRLKKNGFGHTTSVEFTKVRFRLLNYVHISIMEIYPTNQFH